MKFTIGQLTFFIICLLVAGFLDFYLGARFGPEIFWGIRVDRLNREILLPSNPLSGELEALLAEEAEKFTFHKVLENTALSPEVVVVEEISKKEVAPPVAPLSAPPVKTTGKKEEPKKEEIKKEETAKEEQTTKEKPKDRLTLRVGSFSDPEQALSVKKAFISRGYSAFVTEVKIAGKGKWYRVHVGQYSSEEEALKNQSQINQTYKIMPLIVK